MEPEFRLRELIDEVGWANQHGSADPADVAFLESLWPGDTLVQIWKKASIEESCWFTQAQFDAWWLPGFERFLASGR